MTKTETEPRVALVTGGARRIGRAIVERLSESGWAVAIHCRRSLAEGAALAARLATPSVVLAADLAEDGVPESLVRRAFSWRGRLDLLVNNAAVYRLGALGAAGGEDLDECWRVNARAPLLATSEFARLRASSSSSDGEPGRVVNLLDARIASVRADQAAYWLSKRALADATRVAALSFAPGLLVNAVAPGSVLRPERSAAPGGGPTPPSDPAGIAPVGRHPGVGEVAEAVVRLATVQSVTGQVLFVDGGMHLAGGGA